jgi:hypothetical protein
VCRGKPSLRKLEGAASKKLLRKQHAATGGEEPEEAEPHNASAKDKKRGRKGQH